MNCLAGLALSPDAPALITGEIGTGKQAIAQLIHLRTPGRHAGPFVESSCAAVPEHQLDLELFGYETDGKGTYVGLLELADGGTLFLDEIEALPLATQSKLLDVLTTHTFTTAGGSRERTMSARLIAATHRDLREEVRIGAFRDDLLRRLSGFQMEVPPLRDRREEILPLARAFLEEFSARAGKTIHSIEPEAGRRLSSYGFPGNDRELRNIIERAVMLEHGSGLSADSILLPAVPHSRKQVPVWMERNPPSLEELERRFIEYLLRRAGGNRSQVARWMGVPLSTVVKKIVDYGIDLSPWEA